VEGRDVHDSSYRDIVLVVQAQRFSRCGRGKSVALGPRGVIDENAELGFFESLAGPTKVNMKDVKRVNSYGVRAWMEGIRKVPAGVRLEFIECSSATIDQINMVPGFW